MALAATATVCTSVFIYFQQYWHRKCEPPLLSGVIPFVGAARDLRLSFLAKCRMTHGDVFTAFVFGRRVTFVYCAAAFELLTASGSLERVAEMPELGHRVKTFLRSVTPDFLFLVADSAGAVEEVAGEGDNRERTDFIGGLGGGAAKPEELLVRVSDVIVSDITSQIEVHLQTHFPAETGAPIVGHPGVGCSPDEDWRIADLGDLVEELFNGPVLRAVFGKKHAATEQQLMRDAKKVMKFSGLLQLRSPRPMFKSARESEKRLHAALVDYLSGEKAKLAAREAAAAVNTANGSRCDEDSIDGPRQQHQQQRARRLARMLASLRMQLQGSEGGGPPASFRELMSFLATLLPLAFWLMVHIASNKEVRESIYAELRDGASFKTLDASILEVMRLHYAGGIHNMTTLRAKINNNGVKNSFRKGDLIILPLSSYNLNSTLFPEPFKFNIKRYDVANENENKYPYLPVSMESWDGIILRQLYRNLITSLLKTFEIEILDSIPVCKDAYYGVSVPLPSASVKIRYRPRS